MASDRHIEPGGVVWVGNPWVVPAVIVRTITVFLVGLLFFLLQYFAGVAFFVLAIFPFWAWDLLLFSVIWLISMLELLFLRVSNMYALRQEGVEIREGIIKVHSFVVTPARFGELLVYQSLGGRIFGYGEIIINSQGERQTKMRLVRAPFKTADEIRVIMGEPIVRVDSRV